jgi:phage terminase large subunit-like protein
LGQKIGDRRPDALVCDDLDLAEGSYSEFQAQQRQLILTDALLPLLSGERGRVVFCGTVTMLGSLAHQLVKSVTHPLDEPASWVTSGRWDVHYHPAILRNEDGSEVSLWETMWPIEHLQSIRRTRDFAKNMMNQPLSSTDAYWTPEDFTIGTLDAPNIRVISLDPAVTTSKHSDFTGIAVVAYSTRERKFAVEEAFSAKLRGDELKPHIDRLLDVYPGTRYVVIEKNQGGDLYLPLLRGVAARVLTRSVSGAKEVRAQGLLLEYQYKGKGRVLHAPGLHKLESVMLAFPMSGHDDLLDAVVNGVAFIKEILRARHSIPSVRSVSWV